MEKFATLQEIIEIYCISRKLVRNVLRHYNVDFYKKEDEIYINLKEGECVLIDMGCVKERYCSDMTRTFFCGKPDPEQMKIPDLVREANEAAESMIRPGVRFCDIDAAARNHIAAAGYGDYFTHRLGHFIGQTAHEKGDVSSANTRKAEPGMIFSIEPGIYLPGRFGVRIEDLVMVTENVKDFQNIQGIQIENWIERDKQE